MRVVTCEPPLQVEPCLHPFERCKGKCSRARVEIMTEEELGVKKSTKSVGRSQLKPEDLEEIGVSQTVGVEDTFCPEKKVWKQPTKKYAVVVVKRLPGGGPAKFVNAEVLAEGFLSRDAASWFIQNHDRRDELEIECEGEWVPFRWQEKDPNKKK